VARIVTNRTFPVSAKHIVFFVVLVFNFSADAQQPDDRSYTLHFRPHQNKYVPGDTVFLKAYFLDQNNKGVTGKHLLTVSLVDDRGIAVQVVRFSLLAGIGHNQMLLPDSLREGFYNLIGLVNGGLGSNVHSTALSVIAVVKKNTVLPELPKHDINSPVSADRTETIKGKVLITLAEKEFKRRQLIKVDLQVQDNDGKPIAAEFSFKVYNKALVEAAFPDWDARLFKVHDVRHESKPHVTMHAHDHFFNVFQKTGKVYDVESGRPVRDNTQVVFYLQRSQWYHQTFTLDGGSVRLNLPQFNGQDELFYLAESEGGEMLSVRIEWEMQDEPTFQSAPRHSLGTSLDEYAIFKKNTKSIEQSYKAFNQNNNKNTRPESDEFDLVEADNVIKPEQYVPFENLAEMIREVIPALYHRKHGDTDIVRLNLPDPLTATSDPVYIIDGKATTNTKYFLSIPPSEIEYIALVKKAKKLLPLRLLGKNGIVIVKSKSGKFAKPSDASSVLEGLNPPVYVSKPSIPSFDHTSPVFLPTLYWRPSITTDKSGNTSVNFYTTDDIGDMTIEVEGITSDGRPFFAQRTMLVK
jgi:hypothetical protein